VGYSDHSNDNLASCLAVGVGSKIIEKHFTLNKNLKGPDHKASCNPKELKSLVNKIRKSELIMGKKTKKIQTEELEMSKISKKSLYFRKSKKKRLEIKSSDLVALRPGIGLSPFLIHKFIGKKLKRNVLKHELLTFKHI
jgi:sialic acid synthase SpsE